MKELYARLGIDNVNNAQEFLDALQEKQVEHLERLDIVTDKKRRMQLESELELIEQLIEDLTSDNAAHVTKPMYGDSEDATYGIARDDTEELSHGLMRDDTDGVSPGIMREVFKYADSKLEKRDIDRARSIIQSGKWEKGIALLEEMVKEGSRRAAFELADWYVDGEHVPKDEEKGINWLHYLINLGDADAMYKLWDWYNWGWEIEQDIEKGFPWLEKAAELGLADAVRDIASLYAMGDEIPPDYDKAVYWYQKILNNPTAFEVCDLGEAAFVLGSAYIEGKGISVSYIKENNAEAAKWYERAERLGYSKKNGAPNGKVSYALHEMYEDINYAGEECKKAKEYIEDGETQKGILLLKELAINGSQMAAQNLVYRYLHGQDMQQDDEEVAKWLPYAARGEYNYLMAQLGAWYLQGRGTKQSLTEGIRWLERGARLDSEDACMQLIRMYYKGYCGIPKDYEKAFQWCKHRMESPYYMYDSGKNEVRFLFCAAYAEGAGIRVEGLKEDNEEALRWFKAVADEPDGFIINWMHEMYGDILYMKGLMYECGYGEEMDISEAARMYDFTRTLKSTKAKSEAALQRLEAGLPPENPRDAFVRVVNDFMARYDSTLEQWIEHELNRRTSGGFDKNRPKPRFCK